VKDEAPGETRRASRGLVLAIVALALWAAVYAILRVTLTQLGQSPACEGYMQTPRGWDGYPYYCTESRGQLQGFAFNLTVMVMFGLTAVGGIIASITKMWRNRKVWWELVGLTALLLLAVWQITSFLAATFTGTWP
jgi:hypothetical protein